MCLARTAWVALKLLGSLWQHGGFSFRLRSPSGSVTRTSIVDPLSGPLKQLLHPLTRLLAANAPRAAPCARSLALPAHVAPPGVADTVLGIVNAGRVPEVQASWFVPLQLSTSSTVAGAPPCVAVVAVVAVVVTVPVGVFVPTYSSRVCIIGLFAWLRSCV